MSSENKPVAWVKTRAVWCGGNKWEEVKDFFTEPRPGATPLYAHSAPSEPYPLPDDLYDSKDWRAGTYAERVAWLHAMYEAVKAERDALLHPPAPLWPATGLEPRGCPLPGACSCPSEPSEAMVDEIARHDRGVFGAIARLPAISDERAPSKPSDIADAARVMAWARDPQRKPAQQAFTAGAERQAAYWIEWAWAERGDVTAAPLECFSKADRAFFAWWYSHMRDDTMQPPLSDVTHSTARYIWDAALLAAMAEGA